MVGLEPIPRNLFQATHPIAHKLCDQCHTGDRLDRYLVGRQFMVLVLVFAINISGASTGGKTCVLGLPQMVCNLFLESELSMILITCMTGQLNTQINASRCMLDFINDWGNWFTVQAALIIEASGLLHASHLIHVLVARMASDGPAKPEEPPRSLLQEILFWGRVVMSCTILGSAIVVTVAALFTGQTTLWSVIPSGVALILFLVLMCVVGMLEGMQIAFFAVSKLTEEERSVNVWSARTSALLFQGEGQKNLPSSMVGRQLCVVS